MSQDAKPVIAVLGGCGFIGRHVVDHLIRDNIAKKVVVVDKRIPAMAWLSNKHKESFSKVSFMQANLIKPQSIANVFDKHPDIKHIINCAAETRPGLNSEVYKEGVYDITRNCGLESERRGVESFVEVSDAALKYLQEESSPQNLCIQRQVEKMRGEGVVQTLTGVRVVIARVAMVYGEGDVYGLALHNPNDLFTAPYLIFAGLCKFNKQPMQMLWERDQPQSTVHVSDVSRALVLLCLNPCPLTVVYLVDQNNTTQGVLADHLSDIFRIKCSFLGHITTTLAKSHVDEVMERVSEEHLPTWLQACRLDHVCNTPLYPVFIPEHLNKTGHIETSNFLDFKYQHAQLTAQHLSHLLQYYINLKLFPQSLLTSQPSA